LDVEPETDRQTTMVLRKLETWQNVTIYQSTQRNTPEDLIPHISVLYFLHPHLYNTPCLSWTASPQDKALCTAKCHEILSQQYSIMS